MRGCIGSGTIQDSLAAEIQHNAISAATSDPRFTPLRVNELHDLEISVDVLSPAEKINDISIGSKRYGVIVSYGLRRGVLLPDLEGVDTAEEQVEIARQAGIGADEPFQLSILRLSDVNKQVTCRLCPHYCINEGQTGFVVPERRSQVRSFR